MDRLVPSATMNLCPAVAPAAEAPISSRHRQGAAVATRRLSGQLGCTAPDIPTAHHPVNDPINFNYHYRFFTRNWMRFSNAALFAELSRRL